jgi:hypothetical protein
VDRRASVGGDDGEGSSVQLTERYADLTNPAHREVQVSRAVPFKYQGSGSYEAQEPNSRTFKNARTSDSHVGLELWGLS